MDNYIVNQDNKNETSTYKILFTYFSISTGDLCCEVNISGSTEDITEEVQSQVLYTNGSIG